jgi:uncharacterized protein YxjI
MTETFVSQLRAPDDTIMVGDAADGERVTVRVQMPEVWDVIRISAGGNTPVAMIKQAALRALYPEFSAPGEFMLKLNGFEILDEDVSIGAAGAKDGSTFLLTFRRRRPVR